MSVYPEVLTLHLEDPLIFDREDVEVWREMRQVNERRTRLLNSWAVLSKASGSIFALWTLALACKVTTLSVRLDDPSEAALLPTLLGDTNPFRLDLYVTFNGGLRIGHLTSLLVGVTSVKRLQLSVRFNRHVVDSGPQILNGVLSMLGSSEILTIDAVISASVPQLAWPVERSILDHLHETEDRLFVAQLVARVPSLCAISMNIGRKKRSHWTYHSA
ncbi:hypothetical protein CERSUDRAFT_100754 [Gelatoporia subvermispora B]|uniref:F-box domain-containing protein n=1 Tax=Ceriporiopsis subvermispora (strain B) TaxID=914234 RepID=M2P6T5_CERS8|nr:hypothetical protein CERSUDRAFT_100754 [Gelatoporia subvermispora B]